MTPSSGSGTNQIFTFLFSDANGATDLHQEYILINQTQAGDHACMTVLDGANLYLLNDTGTVWLGPITLGSSSTLENSQCTLSGAGSSTTLSGTNLTVRLLLTFKPAFTGTKTIYALANDRAGLDTGMLALGTWIIQ